MGRGKGQGKRGIGMGNRRERRAEKRKGDEGMRREDGRGGEE